MILISAVVMSFISLTALSSLDKSAPPHIYTTYSVNIVIKGKIPGNSKGEDYMHILSHTIL